MKDIELVVNAWYREWNLSNDNLIDSFEDELYKVLPNYTFTYDNHNGCYILLGGYHDEN